MIRTELVCDGCGEPITEADPRTDLTIVRVGAGNEDGTREPVPPPTLVHYHDGHVPERVADLKPRED